jgi:hypothetical protein
LFRGSSWNTHIGRIFTDNEGKDGIDDANTGQVQEGRYQDKIDGTPGNFRLFHYILKIVLI